jgi:hypothetical protein
MGAENSSLTRVQPILNALLDGWPDGEPWLGELWQIATLTRPGAAIPRPLALGRLLPNETPEDRGARKGRVFERIVAPPGAFLRWLLENPTRMQVSDPANYGATSEKARAWRRRLFSRDSKLVAEAQREGLKQLEKCGPQGSGREWWAFEGFTHFDACLITDRIVLFVEGKRTETVSPSTLWFKQRSQLWRNVEAAEQFAQGKDFGVILAVESGPDGLAGLADAEKSLDPSYPHLSPARRAELFRNLLGFVTWPEIVTRFGLPPDCMVEWLG